VFVIGYVCECGLRGAYFEVVNMDPDVKSILFASVAAKLCPTVIGQVSSQLAYITFSLPFSFLLNYLYRFNL
jgi:hypothetical protein